MPDSHALLSASSAHRWLHCPPSALAVDGVADTPSDAALQGTAAHALAEYKLLRFLKRRAKRPTSEWIDEEMEGHTDAYITHWNTVRRQVKLKGLTPAEYRDQALQEAA